ncbi:MAG: urease accessory protein UreD [Yoonia sp.]|nr:urease accessory protein UreD [Yoonia sp.]
MLDALSTIQPRSKGRAVLSSKRRGTMSALDDLHQAGCLRVLFPRGGPALDAVLINTSGGVTGGDHIALSAQVGKNSALTITTQAAERAYRAQPDETGEITTDLIVENGALLRWLPQELILFEGSRLHRNLSVNLAPTARALLVEPIVFGRVAMGETLTSIHFRDRIAINRGGTPLYIDGMFLSGDTSAHLSRMAVADGATAMASALYIAPDAAAHLHAVRASLPPTGGASLLACDTLVVRILASDSYILRQSLIPILERLSNAPLPATWRL